MKYILLSILLFVGMSSCHGFSSKVDSIKAAKTNNPDGLNPCHRFEFTDCEMKYNGKPFMLGQTIDQFVEVFGPYDRRAAGGVIYLWDNIGIEAVSYDFSDTIQYFYVKFNMDMSDDDTRTTDLTRLQIRKKMIEQSPKYFFKGNILVDGVPLGRGSMKIDDFLKKSHDKWSNDPFPVLYKWETKKCNKRILYTIRISGDGKGNIENFYAYIKRWD